MLLNTIVFNRTAKFLEKFDCFDCNFGVQFCSMSINFVKGLLILINVCSYVRCPSIKPIKIKFAVKFNWLSIAILNFNWTIGFDLVQLIQLRVPFNWQCLKISCVKNEYFSTPDNLMLVMPVDYVQWCLLYLISFNQTNWIWKSW